jgi:hypothetical protein
MLKALRKSCVWTSTAAQKILRFIPLVICNGAMKGRFTWKGYLCARWRIHVRFNVNSKPWQNLHKIIGLQYSLLGTPRTMWIVFRVVRNMSRWKFILLQISKGVCELLLLPTSEVSFPPWTSLFDQRIRE